ncbi:MAG: O-antigen ligase family protein, partial [Parcubacteria group bacterium]|nr:O-antigen ligase family protein [Parcubacteria group bacterium]
MEMTNVKIQMSNIMLFKYSVVFIALAEVLSFLSFQYPQTSAWFFGVASVIAIALTIRRLEYGVMLVFGELVIGSFGRMLEISIGGFDISIRMALWLVVLVVWFSRAIQKRRVSFYHSNLFKPYVALAVILGWGIVWGIIRGNPLGLIFLDVNNYLYFALIFPVYDVLSSSDALRRVGAVIATAIGYVAVKTIALFYIFSHELFRLQDALYAWSRASHLVEITNMDPAIILSRIFMQSQIWLVFGVFMLLGVLFMSLRASASAAKQSYQRDDDGHLKGEPKRDHKIASASGLAMTTGLLILSLAAIIASFSRSFWLSLAITFIVLVAVLLAVMREKLKTVGRFIAIATGIGVLSVGLVIISMQFPIPQSTASPDLIKNRAGKFTGEAAVSSRYAQIKPLLESIKNHPVLGSGFGTS